MVLYFKFRKQILFLSLLLIFCGLNSFIKIGDFNGNEEFGNQNLLDFISFF